MDAHDMDREAKKAKTKECCKKFCKATFSHLGLTIIVTAYAVAGGFIFEHLETHNEKSECIDASTEYVKYENTTLFKLAKVHQENLLETDTLIEFKKILESFRNSSVDLGYKGTNCSAMGEENGPQFSWSFAGSLLFAVTVITTIGYGNIAPKTDWGRIVCMAYATLGIPLMLLWLANVGDVMADAFRFLYSKVCCCGCFRKSENDDVKDISSRAGSGTKDTWNTGMGYPNHYPSKQDQMNQKGPTIIDDYDDDEEDEEDEDDKVTVPLTITLLLIVGFILVGALLFGKWEDWKPLKAAYFCFVTVTTIGFGDVVPGFETHSADATFQLLGSTLYILLGMANISMCFTLIQDEIVAKFKWIGEKMGLVDKDKDEDKKSDE